MQSPQPRCATPVPLCGGKQRPGRSSARAHPTPLGTLGQRGAQTPESILKKEGSEPLATHPQPLGCARKSQVPSSFENPRDSACTRPTASRIRDAAPAHTHRPGPSVDAAPTSCARGSRAGVGLRPEGSRPAWRPRGWLWVLSRPDTGGCLPAPRAPSRPLRPRPGLQQLPAGLLQAPGAPTFTAATQGPSVGCPALVASSLRFWGPQGGELVLGMLPPPGPAQTADWMKHTRSLSGEKRGLFARPGALAQGAGFRFGRAMGPGVCPPGTRAAPFFPLRCLNGARAPRSPGSCALQETRHHLALLRPGGRSRFHRTVDIYMSLLHTKLTFMFINIIM